MTIRHAAETQAAFMNACRQHVKVGQPNGKLLNLYIELMVEEVQETVEAWNKAVQETERLGDDADVIALMSKVLDGIMDTIFVSLGAANSGGFDAEAAWQQVVKSNQSKLGPNPQFREDGKLLKDANFVEPDFARVVRESWAI